MSGLCTIGTGRNIHLAVNGRVICQSRKAGHILAAPSYATHVTCDCCQTRESGR